MRNRKHEDRPLRILHLEDSPQDAEIIRERLITAGFSAQMDWATNESAFKTFLQQGEYDLILADYQLLGFDAPAALRMTAALGRNIPFICVSGAIGEDKAVELLKQGATDYVLKERLDKLPLTIKRALAEINERKALKASEEKLRESLEQLRRAMNTTIQVMVSAVETRDPYTAGHQSRTADLARAIAKEMGLPQDKIEGIRMAGPIHDIGKLSIPAELLSKPTKLHDIELSLIREHARIGFEILKHVESPWPLAEIVFQHHERMDGSGYPRHLKGEEILMEARIIAVADVVEAMSSHRPYRPALGIDASLKEIEGNMGILYDADAVAACLRLFHKKGFRLGKP